MLKRVSFILKLTIPADERAKPLAKIKGNTDIITGIANMDRNNVEKTKKKFEVTYFVAKNELHFTKYEEILKLKKMHGVEIGTAYNNEIQCGQFIDYIGQDLKHNLNMELSKAKLFGTLCDGSMDSASIDEEVVYLSHFDPQPAGSNEVAVQTSFLGVRSVRNAKAVGVQEVITDSYKGLTEEHDTESFEKKLIGFKAVLH